MSYLSTLRFGIETLDELLSGKHSHDADGGQTQGGISFFSEELGNYPTSICLAGPDGTGKSVLAMHLAAHYAVDRISEKMPPKIVYVSTDLKAGKAKQIWNNFLLDQPLNKPKVFTSKWFESETIGQSTAVIGTKTVELNQYKPFSAEFAKYLCQPSTKPSVAFVDLASDTAGDDWAFLNRTLSILDAGEEGGSPHLIIVDAVEGLEAFAGSLNIYGQEGDRRGHVAQLMRIAGSKCHVVLVVEEADDKARLPEEYVTDVVLRLRNITSESGGRTYLRRTIEIEKARAQTHVRGQHLMLIRDGKGSFTGSGEHQKPNPDNPPLEVTFNEPTRNARGRLLDDRRRPGKMPISYIHIVHSLDYQSRTLIRDETSTLNDSDLTAGRAGFGIHYLDQVLSPFAESTREADTPSSDSRGLPWSTLTAVVGEHGTHRNRLAHAFLSQCFADGRNDHVAVLISTSDIDAKRLSVKLAKHFETEPESPEKWCDRIVCRRLEAHDLSPAALFHIVVSAVRHAQAILRKKDGGRKPVAGRIRLVVTNLDSMKEMFPGAVDHPLLLPALRLWLSRQDVTTVVVQTDAAGNDRSKQSELTQVICATARHTLYTWHVPFFGELRVAIAAIPPITDATTPIVRELRPADVRNEERLHVDPHFELYEGILEHTEVKLVPLQVRLWGREAHFESHVDSLDATFREVFGSGDTCKSIVLPGKDISYEELRSAIHLKGNMRLNHTLVLQVDEFWHAHHRELKPMEQYLFSYTTRKGKAVVDNDPYLVFQDTKNDDNSKEIDFNRQEAVRMLGETARTELKDFIRLCQLASGEIKSNSLAHPENSEPLDKVLPGLIVSFQEILAHYRGLVKDDGRTAFSKAIEGQCERIKALLVALKRIQRLPTGEHAQLDRLRIEFFRSPSNHYHKASTLHQIDRVPYFWDFGFLMLRKSLWQASRHKEFVWKYSNHRFEGQLHHYAKIEDVFNRLVLHNKETDYLRLPEEEAHDDDSGPREVLEPALPLDLEALPPNIDTAPLPETISWRVFLHACSIVARTAGLEEEGHVFGFDIDMVGPESFCCFILEVWFSVIGELHGDFLDRKRHLGYAKNRNEGPQGGLAELLEEYLEEFYLAWLLLGEVLSASQFGIDLFTPKVRRAKSTSVAARHWYASAASIQAQSHSEENLVPGRLPGYFSVRGDWFLAIAAGSRSALLGERAIDILSTRKSSLNRLKEGIGLPLRDFSDINTSRSAPTRISVKDHKNRIRQLSYGDLLSLGPDPNSNPSMSWLWRYTMRDYDRQSGVFLQMISAILKKAPHYWDELLKERHRDLVDPSDRRHIRSGFEAYDLLKEQVIQGQKLKGRKLFADFEKDCAAWVLRMKDSAIGEAQGE